MTPSTTLILLILLLLYKPGDAQTYPEDRTKPVAGRDSLTQLSQEFGLHKKLPQGFESQALEALSHFPELTKTPVKFKVKASRMTAKTRPTFISSFLPRGNRSYIITISNKSIPVLSPVLLGALPREAQVGLLGHELSHVADFSRKTTIRSFGDLVNHLSAHWLDKMEYHTDWIAIQHGLGKNLKAWSTIIRNHFHVKYWRGSGHVLDNDNQIERYMNPDTIEKYMQLFQTSHP